MELEMFKPVEVKALPNYRLWVKYSDGIEGNVDLSQLVGRGVFSLWNDFSAFQKVYIGGSGEIAWSETIDICPDAVYMKITGKTPQQLFLNIQSEGTYA
jgi:hypothetical protein